MGESPLGTYSKVVEERDNLKAYADDLLEKLKWLAAINAVLLQEQGGLVEISQATLEGIDLNKVRTEVTPDDERGVYVIEGIYEDDQELS